MQLPPIVFYMQQKSTPPGLIGTASHPDEQKIWIIRFFFDIRLQWQFGVRLLLFTACTCVLTFRTRLI